MRSVDVPASLSPGERLAELAAMFASGILRRRSDGFSSEPTACTTGSTCYRIAER